MIGLIAPQRQVPFCSAEGLPDTDKAGRESCPTICRGSRAHPVRAPNKITSSAESRSEAQSNRSSRLASSGGGGGLVRFCMLKRLLAWLRNWLTARTPSVVKLLLIELATSSDDPDLGRTNCRHCSSSASPSIELTGKAGNLP